MWNAFLAIGFNILKELLKAKHNSGESIQIAFTIGFNILKELLKAKHNLLKARFSKGAIGFNILKELLKAKHNPVYLAMYDVRLVLISSKNF